MAAAAPLIALQVASHVVGAVADSDAAYKKARVLDENARLTELSGEQDVLASMRQNRMQDGAAMADSAASGGVAGGGSTADLIYANAMSRQMEAMNIRAGAAGEARNYRAQARAARSSGKAALVKGVFRAGAAALAAAHDQKNAEALKAQTGAERAAQLAQPLGTIPVPKIGAYAGHKMNSGMYNPREY